MSQHPRPTRSEQRDAARAKARAIREQRAKGDKRKRLITTTAIIAAVVAVIATVSWVVVSFSEESKINAENAKKVPANVTAKGGIIIGKDLGIASAAEVKATNHIVIYQDYQCPACEMFESANLSQIRTWVQGGFAVVEFHPISFLDGSSLNNYSSRAMNAALCVANSQPEKFFDVNTALYANQPAEGTSGPEANGLKDTLRSAGVDVNSEINTCIDQTRYKVYIGNATNDAFSNNAVTGNSVPNSTPHVLVNGAYYDTKKYDITNPGQFAQFFTVNSKK